MLTLVKKSKKHNIQIILKNLPHLTKRPQIVLRFIKHKLCSEN